MVFTVRRERTDTSADSLIREAEAARNASDDGSGDETDLELTIEIDDVVELRGLLSSHRLNGRSGVVMSKRCADGRFEVDVGDRQIRFKEENLALLGKGIRGHADRA